MNKKYELYEHNYSFEEDQFEGNILSYLVSSSSENLKNFLESNIDECEELFEIIKNKTKDVLIIKNLNVEEEYRGQGFGSQILNDVLSESNAECAILVCDIGESQLPKFNLEKFYESNNFLTILTKNDYPLMLYPENLASEIKDCLNQPQKKIKFK